MIDQARVKIILSHRLWVKVDSAAIPVGFRR
jgi:hypothetical protein